MLIMKVLVQLNFFPSFLSIKHVEMLAKFFNPKASIFRRGVQSLLMYTLHPYCELE
jgi:hypothetical protein